jgi:hypothetical protein
MIVRFNKNLSHSTLKGEIFKNIYYTKIFLLNFYLILSLNNYYIL